MNSKITVLRESRHNDFLQSRRQDPVTHKVFTAGDRVTRCATCFQPFLEQSWQAIGRTHCGQFASVALEDLEPQKVESGPPETGDSPDEDAPVKTAPEDEQVDPAPLALAPIPNELKEVPVNLK